MGGFNDAVYAMVSRIPAGKVASYGQIARLIGQPRKARFVGYAMHSTPQPQEGDEEAVIIPSHRVVFKDGALCEGYAFGGPEVQRALLEAEGVLFTDDDHVDMKACQWDGRAETGWGVSGVVGVPGASGVACGSGAPGAPGAACTSDAVSAACGFDALGEDVPLAPPADFDWEAELGDVE